jgi:hypothetical protein
MTIDYDLAINEEALLTRLDGAVLVGHDGTPLPEMYQPGAMYRAWGKLTDEVDTLRQELQLKTRALELIAWKYDPDIVNWGKEEARIDIEDREARQ